MATLAQRIKTARLKVHISQWRLAKDSGVDPGSLSRIESGSQKRIGPEVAERLATVLKTTASKLMGIK